MRPRVFPAEDPHQHSASPGEQAGFNEAAGIPRGRRNSMLMKINMLQASMRPRVFPAEDSIPSISCPLVDAASMRPRVFPAEDCDRVGGVVRLESASMRPRVFPAEDRHPAERDAGDGDLEASMRPRVFPAEDFTSAVDGLNSAIGFNEAAGIPRGRRATSAIFNAQAGQASMRPRVFPAEDRP